MRILLLNTYDYDGGAAAAAYRLHTGLRKFYPHFDVKMLVGGKRRDDDSIICLPGQANWVRKSFMRAEFMPTKLYRNRDRSSLFSPGVVSTNGILSAIKSLNPDIVHMHWVNTGLIRIKDIGKIGRPVVWTMHDMWPFTGGCHYDQECGGYARGCGTCPCLSSSKTNDLSRWSFDQKRHAYEQLPSLTLNGPSRWMMQEAQRSQLAAHYNTVNLPNPIDTNEFYPEEKHAVREAFGFPQDHKLVLFGAMSATSNPRKGFDLASAALTHLSEKMKGEKVSLVVMGSEPPQNKPDFPFDTHYTGWIKGAEKLRALYSAADVFLSPSRQENLSNMIVEAMACGTPVVAFQIGGNGDMIQHQQNGYLATPYDVQDLATGLEWVISHVESEPLSENAREKVLSGFSEDVVIPRHLDLYTQLLSVKSSQALR